MSANAASNIHPLPYRILWTWDSWVCDPFSAESYVTEYKNLIDFMAKWDYNGLIIWGFIDDRHGGESAAKEVAAYGSSKGIRVMPGVGAGGYCGYVISQGHKYHLPDFLKERPDLRAFTRENPDEPSDWWLCLYQEDGLRWIQDGARWLSENFDIGGVNIETNEMWNIDVCSHAAEATKQEPNRLKYAASFSDLALTVPRISGEIKKHHPDAWITYATYEPGWWDRQEDAWLLKDMPDDSIAQWNIEMNTNNDVPSPVKNNVSLIHSGGWSYHLAAFPPIWGFTQYRCFYPNIEQARAFARNLNQSGFQGFVLGNAGSAAMPDNEISYIAYNGFTREPEMTVDDFSRRFIGELYGNDAEPLVKELMLKQPSIHERVSHLWKVWTELMLNRLTDKPLPVASEVDIMSLESQIDLANKAFEIANGRGKQRLSVILQVLREYKAIAELSTDPMMSRLVSAEHIDAGEFPDDLRALAVGARDAGLPDEIYKYTHLL